MPGKFTLETETQPDVLDWGRLSFLSAPNATGAKQLTVIGGSIFPGKGHNFHHHPDQEEVLYVISGTIEQWVDREKRTLGPGDSAYFPAGVVHATFNAGTDEATVLAVLGPCVGEAGIEQVDVSGEAPWSGLRADAA
jgi:quercetin dioxygenase-like cupin family protein